MGMRVIYPFMPPETRPHRMPQSGYVGAATYFMPRKLTGPRRLARYPLVGIPHVVAAVPAIVGMTTNLVFTSRRKLRRFF
jgi:hypothetical protein